MSKLEPTRTSSDLTATEQLRRLLDERGVEWESGLPTETIVREPYNALYVERPDGRMHVYFRSYLTPEQAIAATLGPCNDSCNCTNGERTDLAAATLGWGNVGRYVGLRRGKCWERMENSDYYCGGCGWKVTDHDSYCPECGGALHEATLGVGTCHITDNGPWGYPYVCSACGASFDPDVNNGEFNYCPNCGRRCVG